MLPRVWEERWKESLPVDVEWLDKTLKACEALEQAEEGSKVSQASDSQNKKEN